MIRALTNHSCWSSQDYRMTRLEFPFRSLGDTDRTLRYTCQQNQLIYHPISQFFQRNALSVVSFGGKSDYIHQA